MCCWAANTPRVRAKPPTSPLPEGPAAALSTTSARGLPCALQATISAHRFRSRATPPNWGTRPTAVGIPALRLALSTASNRDRTECSTAWEKSQPGRKKGQGTTSVVPEPPHNKLGLQPLKDVFSEIPIEAKPSPHPVKPSPMRNCPNEREASAIADASCFYAPENYSTSAASSENGTLNRLPGNSNTLPGVSCPSR